MINIFRHVEYTPQEIAAYAKELNEMTKLFNDAEAKGKKELAAEINQNLMSMRRYLDHITYVKEKIS